MTEKENNDEKKDGFSFFIINLVILLFSWIKHRTHLKQLA